MPCKPRSKRLEIIGNKRCALWMSIADKREHLLQTRDELNAQLDTARQASKDYNQQLHQVQLELQTTTSRLQAGEQNILRAAERITALQTRLEGLQLAFHKTENPEENFEQVLQEKLALHTAAEEQLAAARVVVENVEQQLREHEQQRHEADEKARLVQGQVAQLQMAAQEAIVRKKTIEESLAETDFQLEPLLAEIPAEFNIEYIEQHLTALEKRIQRLGAINLAAIEEYETESERKQYLDEQWRRFN